MLQIKNHNLTCEKNNRIIILGASGFIGKRLTQKLSNTGRELFTPRSNQINLLDPRSTGILKSVLRPSDIIVMLACISPDKGQNYKTFKNNLMMAEVLCDALENNPVNHLLYISSDAVFSSSIQKVYADTLPSPDNLYGLMHRTREIMFSGTNYTQNLTIIRPTMILGSDDSHNAYGPNNFLRSAMSSKTITLFGDGEDSKDYIYVDDVVDVILCAINQSISGTFNLASGKSYKAVEVASLIKALTNNHTKIIYTPRIKPITRRFFNIQQLQHSFSGFTPKSLAETLKIMYDEMK